MEWDKLINDTRLGLEGVSLAADNARHGSRTDFRRDFDRLVFSSPFRRLQNKTQVFPLPGSIFVHNRLTHSLEVASVGRSLAAAVAERLRMHHGLEPWTHKLDAIGDIVSAACLAHDLGNPPFGHTGEKTIATWFSEGNGKALREHLTAQQWDDLTRFDGNANAFRVLTHQFKGRRPGGFAMTYSTLAAIVKYPFASDAAKEGVQKFGFFSSEADTFVRVASTLGMPCLSAEGEPLRYARHPLVYLVEAADDICYEVMDIEDAHKLGIIPTDTVKHTFLEFFDGESRARMQRAMTHVDDPNEQVAYLRSCVIDRLVGCATDVFVENERLILDGNFHSTLIKSLPSRERQAYRAADVLSQDKIYHSPDVVDIELAGNHILTFLLDKLVKAVTAPTLTYSRLLLAKVPGQYDVHAPTLYGKLQAVVDHVTGMTDVYALDLFRKLNAMSLKINN